MKRKLSLITTLITFSICAQAAQRGAFYCHSDMMTSYQQYDKAYIQSVSCEEVKGSFWGNTSKEKAEQECAKWAKGLGLKNYHTQYFEEKKDGEDYYGKCHDESNANFKKLENAKLNVVHDFSYTNENPGGSIIAWSNLYVDNFDNQQIIWEEDGQEQAQWIKINNQKYCGFLGHDIAFLSEGDNYVVIRPSTLEKGHYTWNELSRDYDAVKKLTGINADYLSYYLESAGPSMMTFFNMIGSYKKNIETFEIFYSEFRTECN